MLAGPVAQLGAEVTPVGATRPAPAGNEQILAQLAVAFGSVLRALSVAVSPAEVIEIRRVLDIVGGADLVQLQNALRSVTVKYSYERDAFDEAFALFFLADT